MFQLSTPPLGYCWSLSVLAVKGRDFPVFYYTVLKRCIETAQGLCHGVAGLSSATFIPSFRPSAELNSGNRGV